MDILGKKILSSAKAKYADARAAINGWVKKTMNIKPANFIELKKTFPTADLVGVDEVLICFNIKGNHYRLITKIRYPDTVEVRYFMKHSDYDIKFPYKKKKKR